MLVAGFVLVGGRSTRMGRDKARLPIASHLLVDDVAARVRSVAQSVALIGEAGRYRDLPYDYLEDMRPPAGPLGGIEAALQSARGDLNLIVACDMPELRREWLANLIKKAEERGTDCVICRDSVGRTHPLCGVWSSSALPAVRRALDERRFRVHDLLGELVAEYLTIDRPICNINTPAEWSHWQSRGRSRFEEATIAAADGH